MNDHEQEEKRAHVPPEVRGECLHMREGKGKRLGARQFDSELEVRIGAAAEF